MILSSGGSQLHRVPFIWVILADLSIYCNVYLPFVLSSLYIVFYMFIPTTIFKETASTQMLRSESDTKEIIKPESDLNLRKFQIYKTSSISFPRL